MHNLTLVWMGRDLNFSNLSVPYSWHLIFVHFLFSPFLVLVYLRPILQLSRCSKRGVLRRDSILSHPIISMKYIFKTLVLFFLSRTLQGLSLAKRSFLHVGFSGSWADLIKLRSKHDPLHPSCPHLEPGRPHRAAAASRRAATRSHR